MQNLQNIKSLQALVGTNRVDKFQELFSAITNLPGLVVYYPLDEDSGNVINRAPDTFGSFNGNVTGVTVGQAGLVGKAYRFDGVNDDVSLGTFDPSTADLSIVLLHKVNVVDAGNTRQFIAKRDAWADVTGNRWILVRSGGTNTLHFERHGLGRDFGVDVAVSGMWEMLVITHNYNTASGLLLYQDGVLTATQDGIDYGTKTDAGVYIAQSGQNAEYYSGDMQHVAIFDTVLSAAQILKLAQIAGLA